MSDTRPGRLVAGALAACFVGLASAPARAEEPRTHRERPLMREVGENAMVIDAFDDSDVLDVALGLGFRQTFTFASVAREGTAGTGAALDPTADRVASYRHRRSVLELGGDVGLYRDTALRVRLPLVLGEARDLSPLDGAGGGVLNDSTGGALFSVPFSSPRRSGIDYLVVGLSHAVLSQERNRASPTWVLGADVRLSVGQRLAACQGSSCPDPDRPSDQRDAGISRAMHGLVLRTLVARRYGSLEPYAELRAMAESPRPNGDYRRGGAGGLPPLEAGGAIGVELFPWENRELFQRITFDVRLRTTWRSGGRDTSELFDAIGSSQAPSLRAASPVSPPATGITHVAPFATFAGVGSFTWQAGEYVKFSGGLELRSVGDHLVTASDAPDARPAIDQPGRRFAIVDQTAFDVFAQSAVLF